MSKSMNSNWKVTCTWINYIDSNDGQETVSNAYILMYRQTIQLNLSVTTTSIIKVIACDLFSDVL